MGRVTSLTCVGCGREFDPDRLHYHCPECGPIRGTLDPAYDYPALANQVTRASLVAEPRDDMWRYLPLLPLEDHTAIGPLRVGGTPLYPAEELAAELGLARLWIKDDGLNPTGSLKDRASGVAVAKALEWGEPVMTVASSGNAASSLAAAAKLAGIRAVIFVPHTAAPAKIAQLLIYGAEVLLVKGSYDQAVDLCLAAGERWGWYNRTSGLNPFLGEGKKTAAFELCQQLDFRPPDYVLVGVGDGCIYQGLAKGFIEFQRLGLIDRLPRLIGVQAAGAAPLAAAFDRGDETAEPQEPHSLAEAIAVGRPRDQVKALRAARRTDGRIMAVTDDELLWAVRRTAETTGVLAELGGAAGLAGLQRLSREGLLEPGATAAVIVTGTGLKDIGNVMTAAGRQPTTIDPDPRALEEALAEAGIITDQPREKA